MKPHFDHENLDLYGASIEFVSWADESFLCLLDSFEGHLRAGLTKIKEIAAQDHQKIDDWLSQGGI